MSDKPGCRSRALWALGLRRTDPLTAAQTYSRLFAIGSVALMFVSAQYSLWSCNDNTNDPAVEGYCSGDACSASRARGCKRGLKNYHHRLFADVELYWHGQLTDWCWDPYGIQARHTEFPMVPTSPVGGVALGGYIWSSDCSPGYENCLVRWEGWATLQLCLPLPINVCINTGEYTCIGTRIYAGGDHSRNITGGTCPGSATNAEAVGLRAEAEQKGAVAAKFEGIPADAVPRPLARRIQRTAFSERNLRYMEQTGKPLPKLVKLAKQAYNHLTPEQRTRLREGVK